MIRAVLFDLDGTLFDRDAAVAEVFARQYDAFEPQLGETPRERFVSRLIHLDAHGHSDKGKVYATLAGELGLPDALAPALLADFRSRYLVTGRAFPDALPTLEALRQRGKKLGLVTNGQEAIQSRKIEQLEIRGLLDAILISGAEGVRKPDPVIFHRAAARLGVTPAQCCHVGDHPEADVAGAKAAGLHAIWRHVPYWTEPANDVPVIKTLSQVLEHT